MPIVGNPRTFDRKFAFKLRIDGFAVVDFSKVGPLNSKVAKISHREGGRLLEHKSLGLATYDPMTCERGASQFDYDMYTWFSQAVNAPANIGLKDQIVKRSGNVLQLDRDGEVIGNYMVVNMFPTEFSAGEWDGSANEVQIQKLVLEYDYFIKIL